MADGREGKSANAERYKRAVFQGIDSNPRLEIQECPALPDIGDGEILGRLRAATICGSDLHTFQGKRKEPTPSVLGHEGVIEVIRHKRQGAVGLKTGDRLTFHVADCCYRCEYCLDGLHQKCTSLFKYGHALLSNGAGANGCYATHIVLRKGTHVVKIPDHISDKTAAPLNCALATMLSAVDGMERRRSGEGNVTRRKTALIQGAGLLGIYGCAILHEAGYDKVYCSDVSPNRLQMISKFGGIPLGPDQERPKDNTIDTVIEVCGVRQVVSEGISVLRPGGTYVLVGMVHPNSRLDMLTAEQIIRKCLTIKGVHNYGPHHLDQAVDFLSRTADKYPYEDLISPAYCLDDIVAAFDVAAEQKYFRVLIEP